jgi:hypothetical protein
MTNSKQQRTRRDERLKNPTPMRLTERDIQIIRAVYDCRVLTTQQLQSLFFPSLHQAYARLSLLYHHGFLDRKFLGVYADKMNTPIMYVLERRGAELLQAHLGLDLVWSRETKELGTQFLEHTLAINSVRIAVTKAAQQAGFTLVIWLGESDLKSDYDRVNIRTDGGRLKSVSLIPDSYFVLETPKGKAAFCLELDRGTMTTQRFKTKVLAYQAYYQSGDYQRRYQTRSLRVLTVTLSEVRAANLQRVTEAAEGKQRFWFAVLNAISAETVLVAPIWKVATSSERQALITMETE